MSLRSPRAALVESLHLAVATALKDPQAAQVADLGERLRSLCVRLVEDTDLDPAKKQELAHLLGGLAAFERRVENDRRVVLAHALRVSMSLRMGLSSAERSAPVKARTASTVVAERQARSPVARREGTPQTAASSRAPVGSATLVAGAKLASRVLGQTSRDPPRSPWLTDVSDLSGVGPKTLDRLKAAGLDTYESLLMHVPIAYRDRRKLTDPMLLVEGEFALLEGVISDFRQSWFKGRFSAKMRVMLSHGQIECRWFQPTAGLAQRVAIGEKKCIGGVVRSIKGQWTIAHPEIHDLDDGGLAIALRYPSVDEVGPALLARLCAQTIERLATRARELEDPVAELLDPEDSLPGRFAALVALHQPAADISDEALLALSTATSPAHRRLAFDEFFVLQLLLLRERTQWTSSACSVRATSVSEEELRACFPFELTQAQWRCIREISQDLDGEGPMLRLIQGDVGSGKTAVAFAAALTVHRSGGQVALMAPTEILAQQHHKTMLPWAAQTGLKIALLTGNTGRAQRSSLLALLAAGKIDLLIGTHALLVEDVAFRSLGLVVVDEQHRFGVEQREQLRRKGEAPHLLVMTATPIPRSLALTAFGELEVSLIDELPPGRLPVSTSLHCGARGLKRARNLLSVHVRSGHKAFVVCPLVEASETVRASDVEATAQALREEDPEVAIGVLHGRMSHGEKTAVMADFREGKLRVLVATTVVEVGVDIPDATLMLVEHAERFGLAQLHQLRGRVGRGGLQSSCLLHTSANRASETGERLATLEESNDGFFVAERDLELRGPGDIYGTKQAGLPTFRFARFDREGLELLIRARELAKKLLEQDSGLDRWPRLRDLVEEQAARRPVFAGN